MLRVATALTRCLYHRVIRLDLKKNKPSPMHDPSLNDRKLPLSEHLKQREQESQEVSLRTLRKSMEQQGSSSKEQQQLNRMIKAEIKVSALLKLHKERHFTFTPTNLVNLLIKVLELRQINIKQQEPEKILGLLAVVSKKASKFSPEDMVRFLHSIKKVNVLFADFQMLSPFITLILDEFSARTNETNPSAVEGQIQSFYVISLQTNIKLLHALHHLHFMTGSEFEPSISTLIRSSLSYFHRLLSRGEKGKNLHNVRDINWHFYVSFVRLASQYDMPVEVVATFMRAINMHKKAYHGTYHYLFTIEDIAHNLPSLRANARGENITKYLHVYHIHLFIYELIEKPNELIRMRPLHLLAHCKNLSEFTQDEIEALDFERLRNNTLERVLRFTLRVYGKFFTNNYSNETEKANITKWVQDGEQGPNEFLTDFILLYRQLVAEKMIKNEGDVTQFYKLCLQNFQALTPYSQMVMLRLALQEQPQSCKPLLDIFFGRGEKTSEILKYKKPIEVDAYAQLISHWGKMGQLCSISVDPFSEGCFLKLFFSRIVNTSTIDQQTTSFASRIIKDRPFFSLLIKKYVRVTQTNRNLGRTFVDMTESKEFKRELQACQVLLEHERQDKAKLNGFWQLKNTIRRNIRRALSNYKFMLSLLRDIHRLSGNAETDYSKSALFTELLFNFNEEVKCLHFKELFTKEIYILVSEIADELEKKALLDPSLEIYKISQYEQYDISRISQAK